MFFTEDIPASSDRERNLWTSLSAGDLVPVLLSSGMGIVGLPGLEGAEPRDGVLDLVRPQT